MPSSGVAIASLVFGLLTFAMSVALTLLVYMPSSMTPSAKPDKKPDSKPDDKKPDSKPDDKPEPVKPPPNPLPPFVPPFNPPEPPTPAPIPTPPEKDPQVQIVERLPSIQSTYTLPGPGNKITANCFYVVPFNKIKMAHPYVTLASAVEGEDYFRLAISKGSGKDEAYLDIVAFEGELPQQYLDIYTLHYQQPENNKMLIWPGTQSEHKAQRKYSTSWILLDAVHMIPLCLKAKTTYTVAAVISFKPDKKATDDDVTLSLPNKLAVQSSSVVNDFQSEMMKLFDLKC